MALRKGKFQIRIEQGSNGRQSVMPRVGEWGERYVKVNKE